MGFLRKVLGSEEFENYYRKIIREEKELAPDSGSPDFEDYVGEIIREEQTVEGTGEPDQDYEFAPFDAIVKELVRKGYRAFHKEFDKYQGVYIEVSKGGKLVERFWEAGQHEYGDTIEQFFRPELNETFGPNGISPNVGVRLEKIGEGTYKADIFELIHHLKRGLHTVHDTQEAKHPTPPKRGHLKLVKSFLDRVALHYMFS